MREGIDVHLLWKSRTPEHPKGDSRDRSVETILLFCLSKDAAEFRAKVLEALGRVER